MCMLHKRNQKNQNYPTGIKISASKKSKTVYKIFSSGQYYFRSEIECTETYIIICLLTKAEVKERNIQIIKLYFSKNMQGKPQVRTCTEEIYRKERVCISLNHIKLNESCDYPYMNRLVEEHLRYSFGQNLQKAELRVFAVLRHFKSIIHYIMILHTFCNSYFGCYIFSCCPKI